MLSWCNSVFRLLTLSSGQQSIQIAFDVYQPGVNFKKTDPGLPDFCIAVCRYEMTPIGLNISSYRLFLTEIKWRVLTHMLNGMMSSCRIVPV